MMKFLRMNASRSFEFAEQAIPRPELGQSLLKVKAVGVNHADYIESLGKYKNTGAKASKILGIEFVGQKVDPDRLDSLVSPSLFGGIVNGGAFGEYVAVNEGHLIPFEPGVSAEKAAGVPEGFLTAFQLIEHYFNDVSPGKVVYVTGAAGGVGSSLVQLLKSRYGCKVATAVGGPEKAEYVTSLGADWVFDHRAVSHDEIVSAVLERTEGRGVDAVFDGMGASDAEFHLRLLSVDSTWVLYGLLGRPEGPPLSKFFNELLFKRVRLCTSTLKSRSDEYKSELVANFNEEVMPLFRENKIQAHIGNLYHIDFSKEEDAKVMDLAFQKLRQRDNIGRHVVLFK